MNTMVGERLWNSTCDSTGVAHVIFFAGCPLRCHGCQNIELQEFRNGKPVSTKVLLEEIGHNELADTVVFSGGEPFLQYFAMEEIAKTARLLRKEIWVYTGYYFDELMAFSEALWGKTAKQLLEPFDVIVAGPYDCLKSSKKYYFLASTNQELYFNVGGVWKKIDEKELLFQRREL
jgi:anaerobic ribonucleoside-triphosphate reductase activating protein